MCVVAFVCVHTHVVGDVCMPMCHMHDCVFMCESEYSVCVFKHACELVCASICCVCCVFICPCLNVDACVCIWHAPPVFMCMCSCVCVCEAVWNIRGFKSCVWEGEGNQKAPRCP